ncbi:hypothetical protein TanjilG_12703 [Lupinus angustifolius]|uniref:DUF632 domain-containing protein n=1 Tax=Lupinus angustifolius TaxID=3871 RepID=A0A4P1QZ77_LUPAN|nr:PREDICTED: uncharacterized protein LOC109327044 [Lupinus angustifolius]OIV97946.1 hypothetical protein TanjilG_12703 [Lupinus angustifolius]
MGCGGSKAEESPLVTLCRERRDFLKAASEQRYALAAAHVSYFHSLRDIGDALRKFVDNDLIIATASSTTSSPRLTLPSDEGKPHKKKNHSSSSTSISHVVEEEIEGSHLNLSSGSDFSDSGHIHVKDSTGHVASEPSSSSPSPFGYEHRDFEDWNQPQTFAYYMKRSAPHGKSMVYQEPENHVASSSPYGYQNGGGYGYQNGGFFGFQIGSSPPPPVRDYGFYSQPGPSNTTPSPPPAPPSPPRASAWDFFNLFDSNENGYQPGYLNGYRSNTSSPDSKEVREREGIPELEDETENEVVKVKQQVGNVNKNEKNKKKIYMEKHSRERDFGEGSSNSKAVPLSQEQKQSSSEGSSKTVRFHGSDDDNHDDVDDDDSSLSVSGHEEIKIKSSPDSVISKSSLKEERGRKKGVSFEVDEVPVVTMVDVESSKSSSITTLSAHGTRDIHEVVEQIRDEFETASNFGREVAVLLEVYKPPYHSRLAALKVIFSRILQMVAPSSLPSHPPSRPPIQLSSKAMRLAKAYCGEPGKDYKTNPENISSTLEKLYAWEKKLYKEVKDEEKLRTLYEKQCKRLKTLDDRGAESSKIDATEASIRKLLTKINICIRTVESISGRIHKLRDDELQPQLAELINGLIRMWKFMLKCHQKQFQAIMESKTHSLRINTGLQRDEGLTAILELEKELLNWSSQFNNWVKTQKSYVENLNQWLMRCLHDEPEETADGIAPFSPSRVGAPPIFIICNDWHQAMTRISERRVAGAMHEFAQKLHELWERQDEEQRQRIKAEFLTKDFEKQLRTLRTEIGSSEHEHDKDSNKTALSNSPSDGVSPLDDLKVDLDSMKKKLQEERARHKEAIKLVRDAASNSLQAGLVPIFKTLESFTSEVVKAHEQVRLQNNQDAGDS